MREKVSDRVRSPLGLASNVCANVILGNTNAGCLDVSYMCKLPFITN